MSWALGLGIVGVLLVGMLAYTRFFVHHADQRHPPRGGFVTVDGVETHVLRKGEGNGDPVVLLHGLNGVVEDFTGALIDRLAEEHEVLAIDRPGYGFTDRPDPAISQMPRQAAWLDNLLAELGVEDAIVVGHSLGGALATTYALDHPHRVRGLVLVAPYLYPNETPPDALHSSPDWPLVRQLVAHLFLVPIGRPLARRLAAVSFDPEPMPSGYAQLWADRSLRPSQFLTVLDEARHLEAHVRETADRYAELAAPTIVLAGTEDALIDAVEHAERFHEAVPHAWLRTIEGAGHMLPWTRPSQVLAAVDEVGYLATKRTGGNGHPGSGG